MENCRIIELEKERKEVQHDIALLQRTSAELAMQINQEWQKDAVIESQPVEESSEGSEQPG